MWGESSSGHSLGVRQLADDEQRHDADLVDVFVSYARETRNRCPSCCVTRFVSPEGFRALAVLLGKRGFTARVRPDSTALVPEPRIHVEILALRHPDAWACSMGAWAISPS